MVALSEQEIYDLISSIPDPEIPVITIKELGVLRKVEKIGEDVVVTITPTYTGCPAMRLFEDDIKSTLKEVGIEKVKLKTVYSPAWTTDWLSDETKEKLRVYGIAPPEHTSEDKSFLLGKRKEVHCPRCKSQDTELVSQFGSTACKALYKCLSCKEPFDYFKCI